MNHRQCLKYDASYLFVDEKKNFLVRCWHSETSEKTFLSNSFYKLLEDYRKNMKDASGSSHNPNLHDVNGRVQFSLDFSNTG